MKKLITITAFIFSVCLYSQNQRYVKIEPDSIAINLDIVEKGYHTVWQDGQFKSQHSKKSKAEAKAKQLSLLSPNSSIEIKSPISSPKTSIEVYMFKQDNEANTSVQNTTDIINALALIYGKKIKPFKVKELPKADELTEVANDTFFVAIIADAKSNLFNQTVEGGGDIMAVVTYKNNEWTILKL